MLIKRLKKNVDVERLSPRQLQVYELMQQGKSNGEIAHLLGIATNTVKIHITGIYNKEKHDDLSGAAGVLPRRDGDEVRLNERLRGRRSLA